METKANVPVHSRVKLKESDRVRTRVIKNGHVFVEDYGGLFIDSPDDGVLWLVSPPTAGPFEPVKLRPCREGTFDVAVTKETWTGQLYTNVTRAEAEWLIAQGWAKIEPIMVTYRPKKRWVEIVQGTYAMETKAGVIVQTVEHGGSDAHAPGVGLVFIPGVTLDDIAPEESFEFTGMEEE